jgi:hypothetical protein
MMGLTLLPWENQLEQLIISLSLLSSLSLIISLSLYHSLSSSHFFSLFKLNSDTVFVRGFFSLQFVRRDR